MACGSYFLEETGSQGAESMKTRLAALRADLPVNGRSLDYSAQVRSLADLAARATIIVLFSMMAVRFGSDFLDTGRVTGLFLLLSEALVVVLTWCAVRPQRSTAACKARVLTIVSILVRRCWRRQPCAPLAPEADHRCDVVRRARDRDRRQDHARPQLRAAAGQPRHRVERASTSIVRHPIYMGYLVTHVAFLAGKPVALEHRRRWSSLTRRCSPARSAKSGRWRWIRPTAITRPACGGGWRRGCSDAASCQRPNVRRSSDVAKRNRDAE